MAGWVTLLVEASKVDGIADRHAPTVWTHGRETDQTEPFKFAGRGKKNPRHRHTWSNQAVDGRCSELQLRDAWALTRQLQSSLLRDRSAALQSGHNKDDLWQQT